MRIITTLEGEPITELDSCVHWKAKAAIDSDGLGPHHGDRTAQDDTTLHYGGKPLNADVDKFIVVPPQIVDGVLGIVMGCKAFCYNQRNGKSTDAVVGDTGPHNKLGEMADITSAALGMSPSPVDGGTDEHIIEYTIFPGVPAVVDGRHYQLQPKRK